MVRIESSETACFCFSDCCLSCLVQPHPKFKISHFQLLKVVVLLVISHALLIMLITATMKLCKQKTLFFFPPIK